MRTEWRWGLYAVTALALGGACANLYARTALPYYRLVSGLIAAMYPWKIDEVAVVDDSMRHGSVVRLTADVYRRAEDPRPSATVVSRTQVGEVIETPIVFWLLLLLWPADTTRERLARLAIGVPVFLGLEALTTVCQLFHALSMASALLVGERDPLTPWEIWARFLEAGGRFVVESAAALFVIAARADRLASTAALPRSVRS